MNDAVFVPTHDVENIHQYNMSVECTPPYTPLVYSKTGVYRAKHFFSKHLDCGYSLDIEAVLNEMVLTCTHNQCFEQK